MAEVSSTNCRSSKRARMALNKSSASSTGVAGLLRHLHAAQRRQQPRLMGCDSHRLRHAPNLPPHRPVNRAREHVSLLIADSLDACHTSILLQVETQPRPQPLAPASEARPGQAEACPPRAKPAPDRVKPVPTSPR